MNGTLPVKNDVYGFSFSVQTQLGSTTNQTSTNYGVQTDGTGIQRIPGFGPQFVGRGENAFNSSTFNLFDDLSYTRKIYEGKIGLSDAIRSSKLLEITVQAEAFKAREKYRENWHALSISNSKFYLNYELWKTIQSKFARGFAKESELISAEFEMNRAVDEMAGALSGYLESGMEYSFATGYPLSEMHFFEIKRDGGNSVLRELLKNENSSNLEKRESFGDEENEKKTIPKRTKKKEYELFLEE